LVHLSRWVPTSRLIGIDLSRTLLQKAEKQPYPSDNVSIKKGDIIQTSFAPASVDTIVFSSVIHEVYTYTGYDRNAVRLGLQIARKELRPGGRVIIRDGVKPEPARVWLRCDTETEARFRRFSVEFKSKSAAPGVAFVEHTWEGKTWFVLGLHEANEFLSKKDYLANWPIEVQEEFGVFTLARWQTELTALGFRILEARGYVNPWIMEHRYLGRVWLHSDAGDHPGPAIPYPDTTVVLVGEAV
jgi:SAM-dependent methyltransferase